MSIRAPCFCFMYSKKPVSVFPVYASGSVPPCAHLKKAQECRGGRGHRVAESVVDGGASCAVASVICRFSTWCTSEFRLPATASSASLGLMRFATVRRLIRAGLCVRLPRRTLSYPPDHEFYSNVRRLLWTAHLRTFFSFSRSWCCDTG